MTQAPDNHEAHLRWLQSQIDWNKKNLESVNRDRQRSPFLVVIGIVAAIPTGFVFGWFKAVLVCLGAIALTISALYLTTGHRLQYLEKIASLERELKESEKLRGPTL